VSRYEHNKDIFDRIKVRKKYYLCFSEEIKMATWNPWHGCQKWSAGCANCYVYRIDQRHGRDPGVVARTANFDLPVRKNRKGEYKIPSGTMVYTCFSSDFFVEAADEWRVEAWRMIRERSDLHFFMLTKRIERFRVSLPPDWGAGYPNVTICCTVENQEAAERRMPVYTTAPIRHKMLACEPLLGPIDFSPWLNTGRIEGLAAGGESGAGARVCDYRWILDLRRQCLEAGIPFAFKQTGAKLLKEDVVHRIPRHLQHAQACKAGINTIGLRQLWEIPKTEK
jgi:protein gp37